MGRINLVQHVGDGRGTTLTDKTNHDDPLISTGTRNKDALPNDREQAPGRR
jgi:hypothetical protein